MAKPKYRPGRTLVVFFASIVVLFGLVALAGDWKPALGLDLQGGQRITLRAKESNVKPEAMAEATKIINQRVNARGVTEASVSTQGKTNIVVSIPGKSNQDLVDIVQRQARLGFRMIACSTQVPGPCAAPTAGTPVKAKGAVEEALAWRTAPSQEWMTKYQQATCAPEGGAALLPGEKVASEDADAPGTPMVACSDTRGPDGATGTTDDEPSVKYLLSEAPVEGKDLKNAVVGQNQNAIDFLVDLTFKASGGDRFAKISQALFDNSREQFAIVLDGTVISAPRMDDPNLSTRASITGSFNQQDASALATSLKFGALPVAFEDNPRNDTVGPSLAGNQLSAGIWAGIVGLLLVMLYCAIYYRGLGAVVIASLLVAGVMTYGLVLLLAKAGFTLSLPGIAGLIVAVGITADSFIVLFERIRDEMRDGKSMRVAVESGWIRARNTCLAADAVSLAAAVVLYIFAIDDVRGFAFTLGLSTLIDLVVFFWFTKPLMSVLARHRFFNHGHPLSGLSAATLGVDRITKGATS